MYGPLAHGLLSGHLGPNHDFAPSDWRASSADFRSETFEQNLRVISQLQQFAKDEFGVSLSQLAIAWTLANPAVSVAIVGTRNPRHLDEALAATDIDLDTDAMQRIEQIMSDATPIAGPSPRSV